VDLTIIIVSYNTRQLTLECLRSIFVETKALEFEVIVVDNASTDGSVEAIAAEFQAVHVLAQTQNLGFAQANNLAAKQGQGKYLLLLNPDTVVLDRAIETLVGLARTRPQNGIYGGRTLFEDGTLNPTSCWQRQTLWSVFCRAVGLSAVFRYSRLFDPESYGAWRGKWVREVDIVSGCFLLIRRELWEDLGGFSECFFMYGEEADLCLRARRLGIRPLVTTDARIVHYGGAAETVRADKLVQLYLAKGTLMWRHWPRWAAMLGIGLQQFNVVRRMLMWNLLDFCGTRKQPPRGPAFSELWRRRRHWLCSFDTPCPGPDVRSRLK